MQMKKTTILIAAMVISLAYGTSAHAQLRIRDICRVKGQEENTLQGIGLVVGLKGTGDGDSAPTARALSTMLGLMKNPVGTDARGLEMLSDLKNAKNVALVFVTATVPGTGARQGDKINCEVSAISAKSLAGGILMLSPLLGPRPGNERVYGFAQGPIQLEGESITTGKLHAGCRLEEDFFNPFIKDGKFTLVLDKNQAGFQTAQDIADLINTQSYQQSAKNVTGDLAKALDSVNIEVFVPPSATDEPVVFISQVLGQRILNPQSEARVVINQRANTVVIGAEVEIGAAAITHKNLQIETGGQPVPSGTFVAFETVPGANPKLKALTDRLNAIKVPTADQIEIIKALERDGKLYGKLIVE